MGPNEGGGVHGAVSHAMNTVQLCTRSPQNFGDLTPYLSYGVLSYNFEACINWHLCDDENYLPFFNLHGPKKALFTRLEVYVYLVHCIAPVPIKIT
jgi:hypothetical protein